VSCPADLPSLMTTLKVFDITFRTVSLFCLPSSAPSSASIFCFQHQFQHTNFSNGLPAFFFTIGTDFIPIFSAKSILAFSHRNSRYLIIMCYCWISRCEGLWLSSRVQYVRLEEAPGVLLKGKGGALFAKLQRAKQSRHGKCEKWVSSVWITVS
jgi:hypothetical protein